MSRPTIVRPNISPIELSDLRPIRGRGALSNFAGRYESMRHEVDFDARVSQQQAHADAPCRSEPSSPLNSPTVTTTVYPVRVKSALSYNQSPDIGFDRSLNPYRGCEHGCIYCYARPTHAWLGWSPGLDFETKLQAKINLDDVLRAELARPRYQVAPVAIGANTDAYQPIEKTYGITRKLLLTLLAHRHPVVVITKGSTILRDLDVLQSLAQLQLVRVAVSVTTLNADLARQLEPRASTPKARLKLIATLADHGIPVSASLAPLIPGLNDHEIEKIVEACAQAGANKMWSVMLRLPLEVAPLFEQWLRHNYPDRAQKVLDRLRSMHQGALYNTEFHQRMTGQGVWADLIRQRIRLAAKRHGLNSTAQQLRCDLFQTPAAEPRQASLFD